MSNRLYLVVFSLLVVFAAQASAMPANENFVVLETFPNPAEGKCGVVGTYLSDGRFIVWNGDAVYIQSEAGLDDFVSVATGYVGDPGFIAMAPDGQTALLGSGFSMPPSTSMLYLLDTQNPQDYAEVSEIQGREIEVPSHYWGVYLTADLVALDRGTDDFTRSEIIIVNLSSRKCLDTYRRVLVRPAGSEAKQTTALLKPEGSYASPLAIDPTGESLYVLDGSTREMRVFSVEAVIEAYNASTVLDWETDGTAIGETGLFLSGGVAGFTPDGLLVNGGSEGYLLPGGVQYIDVGPPSAVVGVLDPVGTTPYYGVIYSPVNDDVIAVDATNCESQVAYAAFNSSTGFSCSPDQTGESKTASNPLAHGGDLLLIVAVGLMLASSRRFSRVF